MDTEIINLTKTDLINRLYLLPKHQSDHPGRVFLWIRSIPFCGLEGDVVLFGVLLGIGASGGVDGEVVTA